MADTIHMNTATQQISKAARWLGSQFNPRPISSVIHTYRTYTWDTRGLTPGFWIGLIAASIVGMIYMAEIAPWCAEYMDARIAAETAAGL